jgi:hypothetical protein
MAHLRPISFEANWAIYVSQTNARFQRLLLRAQISVPKISARILVIRVLFALGKNHTAASRIFQPQVHMGWV